MLAEFSIVPEWTTAFAEKTIRVNIAFDGTMIQAASPNASLNAVAVNFQFFYVPGFEIIQSTTEISASGFFTQGLSGYNLFKVAHGVSLRIMQCEKGYS